MCIIASDERRSLNVGIIGAGAAGLCTAKILRDYGHTVTVYERTERIGGTWILREEEEDSDSSMYESLHTNLPRDIMEFHDLSFAGEPGELRFPGRATVLKYLEKYTDTFKLSPMIHFNTRVIRLEHIPITSNETNSTPDPWTRNQWKMTLESRGGKGGEKQIVTEFYDAIVVCNGHYSKPAYPNVKGMSDYTGRIIHSHDYRRPDSFKGKTVIVVGAASSGCDIARDISGVAKQIYLSVGEVLGAETVKEIKNVQLVPRLTRMDRQGCWFTDNTHQEAEVIIFATGYSYDFPFLKETGLDKVVVNESNIGERLDGVYQHVFDQDRISLAYIGLPYKILPFPLFEYQAHWIASVYKGNTKLPPRDVMDHTTQQELSLLADAGLPIKCHVLGSLQFDYCNQLSNWCNETRGEGDPIVHTIPPSSIENYHRARELRREELGY